MSSPLEPFARIWRINEPLAPPLDAPLRDYCPGLWPTMRDCKAAADAHDDLVEALAECEAAAGIAVQAFNETGNACPAAIGLSAERARRVLARIRREAP